MDVSQNGNSHCFQLKKIETRIDEDSAITIEACENDALINANLSLALAWSELSYVVLESQWFSVSAVNCQQKQRVILQPQSGQLNVGCLMALIGKSGSGKSTLIESLTGRRTVGLRGDVFVKVDSKVSFNVDVKQIKIAFIPQFDALLSTLTVNETLLFSSKLKNLSYTSDQHQEVIEQLIEELDLINCKNSRVLRCSGGEKKRLTVATELISKPTFLIIDEPTSGLDSASAFNCVKLLHKLTKSQSNPLAILISIHQPSAKLLNEFDKLYMLSFNGRCLYNGPVVELLPFFDKFNIPCPQYHNPADHALEVVAGDHGLNVVDAMAENQCNLNKDIENGEKFVQYPISKVINVMKNHSGSSIHPHFAMLTLRTLKTTFRDPKLNYARFALHVVTAAALVILYTSDSGKHSGCIDAKSTMSVFLLDKFRRSQRLIFQNLGLIFFFVLFTLFASSMPVVLSFPMEMTVFLRERTNGWYSCFSYYLAKTVADVPFLLLFTTTYATIIYYFSGQISDSWRFGAFISISIIISLVGQSFGWIVGALCMTNLRVAAFVAPLSMLPFALFSGFLLRLPDIPSYLMFLVEISPVRYAFGALAVIIYGFNRCGEHSVFLKTLATNNSITGSELSNNFQNCTFPELNGIFGDNRSLALQEFYLNDDDLLPHILYLGVILIVMRVATYFVLLYKANTRN